MDKTFDLSNIPFKKRRATLVTGYFDLLHSGHVLFLRKCRELGDPLVVGVTAKSVSKKPGRPVLSDEERMIILSELSCVDFVFLDKYGYSKELVKTLQPKKIIFSSGEIFSQEKQNQIDFVKMYFPDLAIVFIPRQSYAVSTTEIIMRVKSIPELDS